MYISSGQTRRQYQAPLATIKMAFTLGSLVLLCGISGLLTGVRSATIGPVKAFYCPNDWTLLKSSCYIYQEAMRTFSDAESICNILGGNLVSIHNGLENAVVLELIRAAGEADEAWIGYTDAIVEADFIWTDGSANSFENFGADEPDDDGDCVVMERNDGEWDDVDCADTFPYVCIMDASRR
ncbi:alpha-N-acetylgalactosamine-specific lectin-like [Syngnathus typhle]|uniref:alpha-N-acetylgalactosamine-specific lectin-like n=1 Tax=Syngnathus typhle TaxID=161592 RepID=UPI002A6A79E6|nr:alpha-N-acetylgalactosamine-specific lectin-like [Syngnathus typhle]